MEGDLREGNQVQGAGNQPTHNSYPQSEKQQIHNGFEAGSDVKRPAEKSKAHSTAQGTPDRLEETEDDENRFLLQRVPCNL